MATFPSGIPALEAADRTSVTLPDSVIRTEMSAGPAKVRRRSTAEPRVMRMGHPAYTTAEAQSLATFFETTVAGGALSFTMDDPLAGTSGTFRFLRPPQVKPQGAGLWAIDVEVEKLP